MAGSYIASPSSPQPARLFSQLYPTFARCPSEAKTRFVLGMDNDPPRQPSSGGNSTIQRRASPHQSPRWYPPRPCDYTFSHSAVFVPLVLCLHKDSSSRSICYGVSLCLRRDLYRQEKRQTTRRNDDGGPEGGIGAPPHSTTQHKSIHIFQGTAWRWHFVLTRTTSNDLYEYRPGLPWGSC